MSFSRSVCFSLAALLPLAAGCGGGGGDRVPTYEVSGKITMTDGSPAADVTVSFSPQGDQPRAYGKTDDSGEYQLTTYDGYDGAAEGSYKVTVTKVTAAPPAAGNPHGDGGASGPSSGHDGDKQAGESGSPIPANYSNALKTPWEATVTKDGENRFDFEIK